eukprot:g59471.t1
MLINKSTSLVSGQTLASSSASYFRTKARQVQPGMAQSSVRTSKQRLATEPAFPVPARATGVSALERQDWRSPARCAAHCGPQAGPSCGGVACALGCT